MENRSNWAIHDGGIRFSWPISQAIPLSTPTIVAAGQAGGGSLFREGGWSDVSEAKGWEIRLDPRLWIEENLLANHKPTFRRPLNGNLKKA